MAQEEGQAQEQPSIEEQALALVGDVDNAKVEGEESQPETERSETTEEAPAPEEPKEEIKPEIRRLKLKYNGEELEKDESEVIELAQKGWDYTQKTQALAKEREELQEKINAQVNPALARYEERLKLYENAIWKQFAPEVQATDWNALAKDNPAEWAQRMQQVNNVNTLLNSVRAELQQVEQEKTKTANTARQKEIASAVEYLNSPKGVPGWNQETYQAVLKAGVENGYKPEVVSNLTDPVAIKVLWKAMKYDAITAAKPLAEKKVENLPKVVKPGTAEKPDRDAERKSEAFKRLRQTGRQDDAIEVAKYFV